MKAVTQPMFALSIKAGDIGLIRASNPFSFLQNLYRQRFNEGPLQASHGFMVRTPPVITEADGLFVNNATFLKDIGNSTKAWFFRYRDLKPEQWDDMSDYLDGMVDAGGHYSIGGIVQFGLQFFGLHKKVREETGMFCTELTGKTILKGGLPYIVDMPAYAVTPSRQLNWFMTQGLSVGYRLAASYDGDGHYFIDDQNTGGSNG